MRTNLLPITASIALVLTLASPASAQGTFGSRSLGSSFTPGNRTAMSAGSSGLSNLANTGQVQSRARYVRQNRTPGQFVGADTQEVSQILRNLSALGGRTARQNLNLRSSRAPSQPVSPAPAVPFQARLEAAFDYTPPSARGATQTITARLQGARAIKSAGPIEVVVEGDTAVLRGQVASPRDRLLAEQLARFEPGIWNVRNEITVAEAK